MRADVLRRDDVGFLDPAVGVGALGKLGRDFDRAILLGDLHDLPALDLEDVARLRGFDPLALERELGRDPRGLDGLAAPDLGVFDGLLAGDIARLGLLLGGDALRRKPLFLRDAGFFNRLRAPRFRRYRPCDCGRSPSDRTSSSRDILSAGDLAVLEIRTDSTSWREAISAELDGFVAGDLASRGFPVRADSVRCDLLVERDARRFRRFTGGNFRDLDGS